MPRLLIISRSHNPLGGADRIIADLCRGLPSRGWDTILGLTRGATFDDPDAYRRVHQDLHTVDIDGTQGTRAARLKSLNAVIEQTVPDIVLSMRVFDAWDSVARRKSANPTTAPRLAVGVRAYEAAYISDVRRCQENIDLCATSGNLISQACRTIGGMEAERVESIGGGVNPPRTVPQRRNPTSPIRLLYAGRLEQHQKRALDLIALTRCLIAAEVPFRLDVCGAGPEESLIAAELKPQIDEGLVAMHGWVDQEALYDRFYPNADCFVHFAAWEGITISPREAMAHGVVPVISEFTGLHAEGQFREGINSLTFPVGRPDIAVKRIAQLLSTAGLMSRLSQAAMESQTGRYSFSGAIDAWRGAFEKCLSLPPKVGSFPQVPDCLDGRLSRWRVPNSLQLLGRRLLNKSVRHNSPGSEWPTASGLMTADERQKIEAFGETLERQQKQTSGRRMSLG